MKSEGKFSIETIEVGNRLRHGWNIKNQLTFFDAIMLPDIQ